MSDHAELLSFVDQLRTKGVRVYEGPLEQNGMSQPVRLELGPIDQGTPTGPDTPRTIEKDLCPCGCHIAEHTNGFCLNSCDVTKCRPEAPNGA